MGLHAGKSRALIAFALSVSTGVSLAHAAPGDIYYLGTLGNLFGGSDGYAINGGGQVAGFTEMPNETEHAFRSTGTRGGGDAMDDLGTLGGSSSFGYAINASGQVAGSSYTTGEAAQHAFRYTGTPGSGGAMADLGTLGGQNSIGYAINASGQVAGYSTTAGNVNRAFRYTGVPGSGGVMHDLGTLGGTNSVGRGINASGQVAGNSYTSGDDFLTRHAFLYTGTPGSGGVMHDLGTLGGTQSYGHAINDDGQVVGESTTAGGAFHAFRYTGVPRSGGVMQDLGTLGGTSSSALAINASGQVAGWSHTTAGQRHAFLYTGTPGVDGRMIDLKAWLDTVNPAEGAKLARFEEATGLSDNGWITGTALYYPDGRSTPARSAFLLDASSLVPEPGGLAMLGLAVPTLLHRRARARNTAGASWPAAL